MALRRAGHCLAACWLSCMHACDLAQLWPLWLTMRLEGALHRTQPAGWLRARSLSLSLSLDRSRARSLSLALSRRSLALALALNSTLTHREM